MSNPWVTSIQTPLQTPTMTLQSALYEWEQSKRIREEAVADELKWRKIAFDLGFGADAKEGTNAVPLENGYELKGVKKLNYKLKAPDGFEGDTVDAVDKTIDEFTRISNEGSFIAARLFKWSVDMSITEYRALVDNAKHDAQAKKLLDELNKVLVVSEATPTLEIRAPKGKK